MPIVNVPSGSARIHSWLSVYLRFAGTFMEALRGDLRNECFAVANEWRLDDTRVELFVTDFDCDGIAGRDADGNSRKRDRLRERRRERAAGNLAAAFGGENFLVAAQHAALALQDQADLLSHYRRGGE